MEDNKLNEVLERIVASLTDEQKQKVKACKTAGELVNLLGELGVELPDELLDAVAGGARDTLFERLLASELGIRLSDPAPSLPVNPY